MNEREIKVGAVLGGEVLPDLETKTLEAVKRISGFRRGVDALNTEFDRQTQQHAQWIRGILGERVGDLMVREEPASVVVKILGFEQPPSLKQILRDLRERSSPDLVGKVFMAPHQYLIRDDGEVYFELYRNREKSKESTIIYKLSDSDLIDLGPLLERQLNDALTGKQDLTALVQE